MLTIGSEKVYIAIPFLNWFITGRLNRSTSCVLPHLENNPLYEQSGGPLYDVVIHKKDLSSLEDLTKEGPVYDTIKPKPDNSNDQYIEMLTVSLRYVNTMNKQQI